MTDTPQTDNPMTEHVEIVDVAPRDGFQAVGPWIPTESKVAVVEGLLAAGVRRIETGAFVSPKAIPQMADTADIHAAVATPEGARSQGESVGLVQGAHRYQGPPSDASCTISRWSCAASASKRAGDHRGRSLPG